MTPHMFHFSSSFVRPPSVRMSVRMCLSVRMSVRPSVCLLLHAFLILASSFFNHTGTQRGKQCWLLLLQVRSR